MRFCTLVSAGFVLATTALANPPPSCQSKPPAVPQYILDYAPLVFLDKNERFNPSDIGRHLLNTRPEVNFTALKDVPEHLTLDNLDQLNDHGNTSVYLTSIEDPTNFAREPKYLLGTVPNDEGVTEGAVSCAIILYYHPEDPSIVDAFYFTYYSFNNGGKVLGVFEDNHVGDWEHAMIRFKNSKPQQLWLSQHEAGEAFEFTALQKKGNRPIIYSAVGGHAIYATSGSHDIPFTLPPLPFNLSGISIPGIPPSVIQGLNFTEIIKSLLPKNLLQDQTSNGKVWDVAANAYAYNFTFQDNKNIFNPLSTKQHENPPLSWLNFNGQWGDQQYLLSDVRQFFILGIPELANHADGPNGPIFKQLARTTVCPDSIGNCTVKNSLSEAL